jgi:hypothetical protein
LLWVGLPAVRDAKATTDMLFLDSLYREAASKAERLSAAMPWLQQRLKKLPAAEDDARRWVAYEEARGY